MQIQKLKMHPIDANDEPALTEFIKDKDIVVSCASYDANIVIADVHVRQMMLHTLI